MKLNTEVIKLKNDIYVKGEYHKSASFFNKLQIHSTFLEENSLTSDFSTQSIA